MSQIEGLQLFHPLPARPSSFYATRTKSDTHSAAIYCCNA